MCSKRDKTAMKICKYNQIRSFFQRNVRKILVIILCAVWQVIEYLKDKTKENHHQKYP